MQSYSQENIKLIKGLYEAASRGDFGPFRQALDPKVEWIEPNVPGLWFSGTHRGAESVWKGVIGPAAERFEAFGVKIKRLYAVGDNIIAIGYFHGRARTTGKELDAVTAHVCTLRRGKIVRFEGFHDTANWLDALGLVHPEVQRMAA